MAEELLNFLLDLKNQGYVLSEIDLWFEYQGYVEEVTSFSYEDKDLEITLSHVPLIIE